MNSNFKLFSYICFIAAALIAWAAEFGISIVYSLIYAIIALIPYYLSSKVNSKFDPFEPYFGLSLLFYLYSISTIIFVESNSVTYYNEPVTDGLLLEFATACLVGQLGLILGYFVSAMDRSYQSKSCRGKSTEIEIRILMRPALFISIIFVPFYFNKFNFLDVVSYSEAAFESRIVRMENPSIGLVDVLLVNPFIMILMTASTVILFDKRYFLLKFIAILLISSYLLTNFLSGWRNQVIISILIPVIYFHYRIRRLPISLILIGGAITYLVMNALSIMRASPSADIKNMWTVLSANMLESGLGFLKLSSSGELVTSTNLLRLIMGIQSGETSYGWGGYLLSQFGAFVPRAIWPDRPYLVNELFVKIFYPGVYESGGGYGLFFHQEGYWDFGLFGILVYAFLLISITRWIYNKLIIKLRYNTFGVILYSIMYGYLVLFVVRTGFVASLKEAIVTALPLLAIIVIAKAYKKKTHE